MYEKVDKLANSVKIAVTFSPMQKDTKDFINLTIDGSVTLYKLQQEAAKNRIRELACRYHLNRVVFFPCNLNGRQYIAFRLYGGEISAFCQALGLTLYKECDLTISWSYFNRMEQQHGTVIYERK